MNKQVTLLSTLTLFLLLGIAAGTTVALPSPGFQRVTPQFTATIDGDLADWAGQQKYVITDPAEDSVKGGAWELHELWISVNDTHVQIALKANSSQGTVIYFDVDPGSGNGMTDVQSAASYGNRPVTLGNGFAADFWIGMWEYQWGGLFNVTHWMGSTDGSYAGVKMAIDTNVEPAIIELSISFEILYGTNNVTGFQLGILPVAYGVDGETALDAIPNNNIDVGVNDPVTLDNYVLLDLDSDGDGIADITPMPTAGWYGNIQDNVGEGNASAGMPIIVSVEVWWNTSDGTVNDHPNTTYAVLLEVAVFAPNGTEVNAADILMMHTIGDKAGNNDVYWAVIDPSLFTEGNTVNITITPQNWAPEHSWQDVLQTKSYYVGPAPVTNVDYVAAAPTGGFIDPADDLVVTATVHWINNETGETLHDDMLGSLPVDVVLFFQINDSEFANATMEYVGPADNNDEYSFNVGNYGSGTTITFFVMAIAQAGNLTTEQVTVTFGVEPPKETVFAMDDPAGDEWGPYPTADAFSPYEGYFDILYFEVSANDYNIQFAVQFANIDFDDWGSLFGFSHEIITIYIDNKAGGLNTTIRNEQIDLNPEYAWDYALVVDGWTNLLFSADDPDTAVAGAGVAVTCNVTTGFINITVPITSIDVPTEDWAYYVFAGSGDYNKFRNRASQPGEWQFGGGDDSEWDANVVDMLVPAGGNSTYVQEFIFQSYSVSEGKHAVALPVGANLQFVEDTDAPLIDILQPTTLYYVVENEDEEVTFTLEALIEDPATATLSGLATVKIFDGTILIEEIPVAGLMVDIEINITISGVGEHEIKVQAFDISGNFATNSTTLTIELQQSTTTETSETSDTTTTTPTSETPAINSTSSAAATSAPETAGGFLPIPTVGIFTALLVVPILRRRKD